MRIRKYRKSDRGRVREICADTALLGDPIDPFLPDRELWVDANTKYYTDKEPESCFVAEDRGRVIGYLFGCVDSRRELSYRWRIAPSILGRVLLDILAARHLAEIKHLLHWFFTRYKFEMPYMPLHYAHLHINVVRSRRSKGVGAKLMKTYFEYLKKKRVKGVVAQVFKHGKQRSYQFFLQQGFEVYLQVPNSLWKNFVPGEVYLVTMVKALYHTPHK